MTGSMTCIERTRALCRVCMLCACIVLSDSSSAGEYFLPSDVSLAHVAAPGNQLMPGQTIGMVLTVTNNGQTEWLGLRKGRHRQSAGSANHSASRVKRRTHFS